MKKINLIKIYEILRYLVYFLGGAVLIQQGKTNEGIGAITLGAATLGKDLTRAKEISNIKKTLSSGDIDSTKINGNGL